MPLPEFWEKYKHESLTKKLLFKSVEDAVSTYIKHVLLFPKKN